MRLTMLWGVLFAAAIAPGQPAAPPLAACGPHGGIEVVCGTRQPEDLEITPDGKYLIATQFINASRGATAGGGMALFDLKKKTFGKMAASAAPDPSWGDRSCPGPIGDALVSHGSSLRKMREGVWRLYVVNHGGRQSIEMYELKPASGSWEMVWHGCVVGAHDYNDVAILPDGGYVGTYPTGLAAPGNGAAAFGGGVTGYVGHWAPGKGESEVPGTRVAYPNGVVVSADGHEMFLNVFAAREVRKYDLDAGTQTGSVKVDFMPDNLTWTRQGRLLGAGVKGARGDCPEGSGRPCIQGFGVAEINPANMQARPIFDSSTHDPLISGVSVAFAVGNSIYLGAFQGDRLVKIPYKR
ncbi:MAG TPA: SMP-30/gluconolactonase/LRE family protein [Bryobacteraceae bacterium]|nr:SMP-30/gluconolactonase/LRE family protein [Bryobacteraceae bacterium]